jgi:hypothetical protein
MTPPGLANVLRRQSTRSLEVLPTQLEQIRQGTLDRAACDDYWLDAHVSASREPLRKLSGRDHRVALIIDDGINDRSLAQGLHHNTHV